MAAYYINLKILIPALHSSLPYVDESYAKQLS